MAIIGKHSAVTIIGIFKLDRETHKQAICLHKSVIHLDI